MKDQFLLNGRLWQVMRQMDILAAGCQLYLVTNGQKVAVVKTYDKSLRPDQEVLRRMYNMDFELLLPLIDYGTVNIDGQEMCFEIGEHAAGETLRQYQLPKDDGLSQLRRIALQGAAAIEYMHRNGILHLDVKPSNFFFTDRNHRHMILGDYGISRICPVGERTLVPQARTPQYAAPEMYENAQNGMVEIGAEADFYSFGMTLLTVCLGHDVFGPDERSMLLQKQQGRLPGLERLNAAERKLIMGLTATDHKLRWGYEEIELWYQDPNSDIDDIKAQLALLKEGEHLVRFMEEHQKTDDITFKKELDEYLNAPGALFDILATNKWNSWEGRTKQTLDVRGLNNRERLTVYDHHTAAYKLCMTLGARPTYQMGNGARLITLGDIKNCEQEELQEELRHGALAAWLTTFFHENPEKIFTEDMDYEHTVEKWLKTLGEIDKSNIYYSRYVEAQRQIMMDKRQTIEDYKDMSRKDQIWKWACIGTALFWILLIIVFQFTDSERTFILTHTTACIILPVGIVAGAISYAHAYFHGLNNTPCILMSVAGFLSTIITVFALRAVAGSSPALFIPAIAVITLVYLGIAIKTDYSKGHKERLADLVKLSKPNDQSDIVEPLYYALQSRGKKFHTSQQAIVDDVNDTLSSMAGENVVHYKLWTALFGVVILIYACFSSKLLDFSALNLPAMDFSPIRMIHDFLHTI